MFFYCIMEKLSFDIIFSYWVLLWLLIYFIAALSQSQNDISRFIYEKCNPLILLFIGLVENIILLFLIIYYNPRLSIIIKFTIIYIVLKIIPIVIILYYADKIRLWENLVFSVSLFALYNVYLTYKKTNVLDVYSTVNNSVIYNKNKTPLSGLLYNWISI